MRQNPYLPIPATIESIVDETDSIKTFGLRPSHPISFLAGQFVELSVPGIGEAPFTPSSSPAIGERMEIKFPFKVTKLILVKVKYYKKITYIKNYIQTYYRKGSSKIGRSFIVYNAGLLIKQISLLSLYSSGSRSVNSKSKRT